MTLFSIGDLDFYGIGHAHVDICTEPSANMSNLEDLQINAPIRGILPDSSVSVVSIRWFGS